MKTLTTGLTEAEQEAWANLVRRGIAWAITGLSQMAGTEVRALKPIEPVRVPARDVAALVGGPEVVKVAVHLRVTGDAPGHMALIFQPESAYALADMLLAQPEGTTVELDTMAQSAMGETGNLMGSFFLNALADASKIALMPSPPAVMQDMAGSVLDAPLCEILAEADDILMADTAFGTSDRHINGTFLVMPSYRMVRKVLSSGAGQ